MKLAVLTLILISGTLALAQESLTAGPGNLAMPQATAVPPPTRAEALKNLRTALEAGVGIARAYSDYVHQQFSLGAVREWETYEPEAAVSRVQSVLAAFDAGLFTELPKSSGTPEAQKARDGYRKSLLSSADWLRKNYDAALAKYKLGINQQQDVISACLRLLDVEIQIAAFDAGLSYTPFLAAGVR